MFQYSQCSEVTPGEITYVDDFKPGMHRVRTVKLCIHGGIVYQATSLAENGIEYTSAFIWGRRMAFSRKYKQS